MTLTRWNPSLTKWAPKPAKQMTGTIGPRPTARGSGLVAAAAALPAADIEEAHTTKTAAEIAHHGRVAGLQCVLCRRLGLAQESPTQVHHLRYGSGMAQRASHWLVAGLCWHCHSGPAGVHGDRARLRLAKCEEVELVAWTLADLNTAHRQR